jgi:imidazolonepropionase-like amidohydrolase
MHEGGPPRATLAVRAGQVFDGERALGPGTVVVDEGRIVDVGSGDPPSRAELLDLGPDACLLPGLVDAHVHLAFDATGDVVGGLADTDDADLLGKMRQAAERAISAGITTVRDLGDRSFLSVALREQLGTAGPEIVAAGPPITVRGGHCHFLGGEADGEEAIRAAVHARRDRGCQVVKVMASGGNLTVGSDPEASQYGPRDLALIVAEARKVGLPAAAHVHGPAAVADAVEAGFDTIEHVTFFTADGVDPDPRTLERIVERQVVVSATVGLVPGAPQPPSAIAHRIARVLETHARLHRAGARIVPGTDAGISPAKPHDVLPYGIEQLTDLGMTTAEALRAATAVAAAACGVGDRKGRLRAGFDADLLAVAGDPLTDVRAIHDVRAVFRAGRRIR